MSPCGFLVSWSGYVGGRDSHTRNPGARTTTSAARTTRGTCKAASGTSEAGPELGTAFATPASNPRRVGRKAKDLEDRGRVPVDAQRARNRVQSEVEPRADPRTRRSRS